MVCEHKPMKKVDKKYFNEFKKWCIYYHKELANDTHLVVLFEKLQEGYIANCEMSNSRMMIIKLNNEYDEFLPDMKTIALEEVLHGVLWDLSFILENYYSFRFVEKTEHIALNKLKNFITKLEMRK